jgi:hypothetical protein
VISILLSNLVIMVSKMNRHEITWKRAQVVQATGGRTRKERIIVMANEDVQFQLVVSIESVLDSGTWS